MLRDRRRAVLRGLGARRLRPDRNKAAFTAHQQLDPVRLLQTLIGHVHGLASRHRHADLLRTNWLQAQQSTL